MPPKPPAPSDRPQSPRFKRKKSAGKVGETSQEAMSLRDFTRLTPDSEDFEALKKEIEGASDRSAAILVSSFVDRFLELAILSRLEKNDEDSKEHLIATGGPLSNFFSKIHLAYAMGLYTINIRNELDAIRKIRNSFAHSAKSLTFETKQIKDECCSFDKSMMIDSDGTTRGNYIDVCGKIVLILFAIIAMQHTKKFLRNDFGDNETTKATANRVADGLENLFRFINNLEK